MPVLRNVPLVSGARIEAAELIRPGDPNDGTPVATLDLTTTYGQRILVAATVDPGVELIIHDLLNVLAASRPQHALGLLRNWADNIDAYLTAHPEADVIVPDNLDDLGPDGR